MRMYQAGILGASTLLAKELMTWLSKWHWMECPLILMDEKSKTGEIAMFQSHYLPIHAYDQSRIEACDVIFDCMETYDEKIAGWIHPKTYVIHMHSYHKEDQIIVPNVNVSDVRKESHHIFIPYASFLLLSSVLAVAKKQTSVDTCIVTSLQSAAEIGHEGREDLLSQMQAFVHDDEMESKMFPLPDAYQHLPLLFQPLPQTTALREDGFTLEETFLFEKMTACFLSPPKVSATCVRVASLHGLSMSITLSLQHETKLDRLVDGLTSDPSFICMDDVTHNMYPICADVLHDYRIYIGRMRMRDAHTFQGWAVCDDLAIRSTAAIKAARYLLHNIL